MKLNETLRCFGRLFMFLALLSTASPAKANGADGDGVGARSMALGGADVAWASDPLGAMGTNPAGLGFLIAPEIDGGGVGGLLDGHFNKPGISSGHLDETPGGLPEGAIGVPLGKWPVVVGLSFVPESTLLANWHYNDPPGGLVGTTSYGNQQDKSELLELRTALGAAGRITSDLSFGASVGLIYNKNELVAPYIFQNLQPGPGGPANGGFDGAKTLLNLNTEGWGWNAQVGFIWRITPDLQVGASYESPTTITSSGDARGDPSLQFGQPPSTLNFHYDAKATNTFPQQVRWGLSWKFQPQWRLATQIDWIDWSDAFHNLPLSFSNGSSAGVNAALGSSFTDSVPLNWKNEFVYRVGMEYEVTPSLTVRAGYCYGSDPVPDSTLTPLNAAIMEHTFTAGVGYHWKQYSVDFAYQYDIPATQNIGASGLLSGEYSNSTIDVSAHIFALTTSIRF
jgi:long-chain fatty acid transport protein